MVRFSKSGFLHKPIHLLMIMVTGLILSSCSGGQTSQQQYRFKVEVIPEETSNYVDKIDITRTYTSPDFMGYVKGKKRTMDINRMTLWTTVRLRVIDANGNPVMFDPDKDYENIVIPFKCASEFFSQVRHNYFGVATYDPDRDFWLKTPQDAMFVLNKRIEMIEKYINFVWELPLTNQPADAEVKDMLNKIYYNLDLKNHSIIEKSRSYDKVIYGLLENGKLIYNPDDLPSIWIERYPDNILGLKSRFDVQCYKGDKYPPLLKTTKIECKSKSELNKYLEEEGISPVY